MVSNKVRLRCPKCGERDSVYSDNKSQRPVYDESNNTIYRYVVCGGCPHTFATVEVVIGGPVADVIEERIGEL